jgi:hypothetical protein
MTADYASQLPLSLQRALGPRWELQTSGPRLRITHRDYGTPYHPPRRAPGWSELLNRLEAAFASAGVPRAAPLPLRWRRETDFTISAIQALDPYLKDRKPYVYREGYLPQPVVRFTGKRDASGALEDGFLTAFVNVSQVQRVHSIDDHTAILDSWIGILSRLGLHARHLTLIGSTAPWTRAQVSGITLHINHAELPIGDIVLLWNTADPSHLVTDLGSGLERLRWALVRHSWQQLIYDPLDGTNSATLDAIRTATLIIGSGIRPGPRGRGGALRRLLRSVSTKDATLGVSRSVRQAHRFWSLTAQALSPWHDVTRQIEEEIGPPRSRGTGR